MKRGRENGEEEEEEIEYEKLRNARLAENRKRMEELGLLGLSHSLAESLRPPATLSARRSSIPREPTPVGPARRSSRIQGGPVVSYAEITKKEGVKDKSAGRRAREAGTGGYQPEIYTEEHEKLLGTATTEWQLFVDGYGANGSRIYDPVRGKTCHQCRQKTMGYRTWCSGCESLHGQFCGDCLYMRYGENVLEVKENKKWMCPVCRNICNCSFCRLKKGWTPTGPLYKRIKSLGYQSVAHYLILTRRSGDGGEEQTGGDGDVPKKEDTKVTKPPQKPKARDAATRVEGGTLDAEEILDTPEKAQEAKPAVLALDGGTSSEDGEGGCKTRWSRRSLNYVSSPNPKTIPQKTANIDIPDAPIEDKEDVVERTPEAEKAKEEPLKRGRGRPLKNPATKTPSFYASAPKANIDAHLGEKVDSIEIAKEVIVEESTVQAGNEAAIPQTVLPRNACDAENAKEGPVKRGRGRPRKNPAVPKSNSAKLEPVDEKHGVAEAILVLESDSDDGKLDGPDLSNLTIAQRLHRRRAR